MGDGTSIEKLVTSSKDRALEEMFPVCPECSAPWRLHWVYVWEAGDDEARARGADVHRRRWNTCGLTRRQLEAKWLAGRSP